MSRKTITIIEVEDQYTKQWEEEGKLVDSSRTDYRSYYSKIPQYHAKYYKYLESVRCEIDKLEIEIGIDKSILYRYYSHCEQNSKEEQERCDLTGETKEGWSNLVVLPHDRQFMINGHPCMKKNLQKLQILKLFEKRFMSYLEQLKTNSFICQTKIKDEQFKAGL